MIAVEQVTAPIADHGEGPIWDVRVQSLRWVDMLAGDVLTLSEKGDVGRKTVAAVVAALRPRFDGGFVLGTERGFLLTDSSLRPLSEPTDVWSDTNRRMNDGACDAQGRFYCGSMAYDEAPGAGALYRLDVDGTVSVALENVTISNGLAWTLAGTAVYYVDSPTGNVDLFDYESESGTFHNRRTVVNIPSHLGMPDGITLDAEGGIWVALWGGGVVHRYSATGTLDAVIRLPVTYVTACTFGGADFSTLYMTTSRANLPPSESYQAGSVFACEPNVSGFPVHTYGGK